MFNCKHGCAYKHTHKGAMNLHEKYHCEKLKSETTTNKGSAGAGGADRGCEHVWRLLTPRELSILKGRGVEEYWEVCTKCQDLQ
jgi:hypothetical protein